MKKFKTLVLAVLFTPAFMWAQQDGINYQAAVRDGSGTLITNTPVATTFKIRQTTAAGTIVYSEDQNPMANAFGLINVVIGEGTPVVGTFNNINWGADTYFLDITINGINIGAFEFKSVPFAHHAQTMTNVTPNTTYGDVDITSNDAHAVLNIIPGAAASNDSSTVFFAEGTAVNNGMAITYDGVANEMKISGTLNGGYQGPHMVMDRSSGNTSFSKGVEVTENTTSPAPNKTYGNSGPLAYGYFTTPTNIVTDYGIASVTNPSIGVYNVVLDNSWSTLPVVVANSYNVTSDTETVTYSTTGNNTISIKIVDENNAPINSNFSLVVYGSAL